MVQVYTTGNPRNHVPVWRIVRGGGHGVPGQHQQACAAAELQALGTIFLLWTRSAGDAEHAHAHISHAPHMAMPA